MDNESMEMTENRTLRYIARGGLFFLVFLSLLLSFVPIVSWWGGLLGLVLLGGIWALGQSFSHNSQERPKYFSMLIRICMVSIFFGLFVHLGCRVYSSWNISIFETECEKEKAQVLD